MHPILKNILAVVTGYIAGSIVNLVIIMISVYIIPPPEGANITTTEGLKASIHLFQPENFIMPFLSHALGTFAGAIITAAIASIYKLHFAMVIGVLFMAGGIANIFMLPSPVWFSVLDLAGAYLPVAYFAGKIATKKK